MDGSNASTEIEALFGVATAILNWQPSEFRSSTPREFWASMKTRNDMNKRADAARRRTAR